MNDFIQAEEYLTRKLKENCDELDKFLKMEILGVDDSTELSKNHIRDVYHAASEKVKSGFEKDCDIFKKSNPLRPENLSEIVSSIYSRGSERIGNLADYKLSLILNKYEQVQQMNLELRNKTRVDKYILLMWI